MADKKIVQFARGPVEEWTETELHCPKCGAKGLWVYLSTHICTRCDSAYENLEVFDANDDDEVRLKALKEGG